MSDARNQPPSEGLVVGTRIVEVDLQLNWIITSALGFEQPSERLGLLAVFWRVLSAQGQLRGIDLKDWLLNVGNCWEQGHLSFQHDQRIVSVAQVMQNINLWPYGEGFVLNKIQFTKTHEAIYRAPVGQVCMVEAKSILGRNVLLPLSSQSVRQYAYLQPEEIGTPKIFDGNRILKADVQGLVPADPVLVILRATKRDA